MKREYRVMGLGVAYLAEAGAHLTTHADDGFFVVSVNVVGMVVIWTLCKETGLY